MTCDPALKFKVLGKDVREIIANAEKTLQTAAKGMGHNFTEIQIEPVLQNDDGSIPLWEGRIEAFVWEIPHQQR